MRRSLLLPLALLLIAAPGAHAKTEMVPSFDGTKIKVNFFPAKGIKAGEKLPTILIGPGWSQAGDANPESESTPDIGTVGVGVYRRAGYNVLTWDPRGFGDSEGTATVDAPDKEGRDVQMLLSYIAKQPEAKLDGPDNPRAGMSGSSYGGEIQLVTAGIDNRVDVIIPNISWNSLTTSLLKDATFKAGWGSILFAAGQQGSLDPHIYSAFSSGAATGKLSKEDEDWFASRGAGETLLNRITIPTFLTQGTHDTLFTLNEAERNYALLRKNGVPTKMMWFCGGHGACTVPPGDVKRVERAAVAWMKRYLDGDTSVDTGPRFDWIDQDGKGYVAGDYPVGSKGALRASGTGTLPLTTAGGSGPGVPGTGLIGGLSAPANGTKATNAVNVTFPSPPTATPVVGAPLVTLTYKATGTTTSTANPGQTRVYGQIVDDQTGKVMGNLTTPIPVLLDGAEHTVARPLEPISGSAKPGQTFTLQIAAASSNYDPQRASGAVQFARIDASLPLVDPAATPAPAAGTKGKRAKLKVGKVKFRKRRATVALSTTAPLKKVTVILRGPGGKRMGKAKIATLTKKGRVKVKLRRAARAGRYRVSVTATGADGSRVKAGRKLRRRR